MSSDASRPRLNITLIGPSGSGKSTLVGHALLKLGQVDQKSVEHLGKSAAAMNREDSKYAWVVDRLHEERGRGLTLDLTQTPMKTPKYQVVVTDVPGHPRYIHNAMPGTFYADCVVLVVDATPGAFESSMSPGKEGGVREHVALAYTLGVRTLVVAVNKMDAVGYSEGRFQEVKKEVSVVLKKAGFNPDKAAFIPTSALAGEGLTDAPRQMPWYPEPASASSPAAPASIVAALDSVEAPKRATGKSLRLTVQDVYNVRGAGIVPAGRVEAGAVRPGMTLRVLPGDFTVTVKAVQEFKKDIAEAVAGSTVALSLQGEPGGVVQRGSVLCEPGTGGGEASSFQAQLLVQHPKGIAVGYCPTLAVHAAHVPCRITALLAKLDRKTGKEVQKDPPSLQAGDVAIVEISPQQPLCVEAFSDCPPLGRFALRDLQQVVGLGVIKSVTYRQPATKAAQAAAAAK